MVILRTRRYGFCAKLVQRELRPERAHPCLLPKDSDSRRYNMNPRPTQLPRATPWRSLPCPRTELRLDLVLCGGQTFRLVRPLAAPSQELQPFSKASLLNLPLGPFLSFFASPSPLGGFSSVVICNVSLSEFAAFLPLGYAPRLGSFGVHGGPVMKEASALKCMHKSPDRLARERE